jgi:hypothetical protein
MRRGFSMKRQEIDEHAANELDMYLENTSELYNQKKSILTNLQKKAKKGIYDKTKAAKLWGYWVEAGARRYVKEFGSPHQNIADLGFNKATREHLATELATRYPEGQEN